MRDRICGEWRRRGEGAALALIISGDKPDPERFDPKTLKGLATGTPTVLVDALLVPIRVKKPLKDWLYHSTRSCPPPRRLWRS